MITTINSKLLVAIGFIFSLLLFCQTAGYTDPIEPIKIKADNVTPDEFFGCPVSIDKDTAIVGATGNSEKGENSGAAYIFVRTVDGWVQQAKLTPDDAAAGYNFGWSVSIDGNTAIIGAPFPSILGSNGGKEKSGAAYVFVRTGNVWRQQAKLSAKDAAKNNWFGYSVSSDGDTAIVGAPGYKNSRITATGGLQIIRYAGAAYIFVRTGVDWKQEDKLTLHDASSGDEFGISVSIDNGTAIVGVGLGSLSGVKRFLESAYIYEQFLGGEWRLSKKLSALDSKEDRRFGHRVSIDNNTIIVGAFKDSEKAQDSGAAYIFERFGDDWRQQAKLTADDAIRNNGFGFSVGIDNGTAIVGTYVDGGLESGAVYIFGRSGNDWVQQEKLTANDDAKDSGFGHFVSIDKNTAIVEASGDDENGKNSGAAYIFEIPHPELSLEKTSLDFDKIIIGQSKSLVITIKNVGNAPLVITKITSEPAEFTIENLPPLQDSILPGQSIEVNITFEPKSKGEISGQISIQSNARDILIRISGAGITEQNQDVNPKEMMLTHWGKVKQTSLLPNYPNPFNPETWIPYALATPAEVTITIHSLSGELIREIPIGKRPAGLYLTKDKARFWDGQNNSGEPVASGIYFYTLKADSFTAVRKMLLVK